MNHMGNILIADDEETFRESTADLLREQGYECFPDAYSAVESIKCHDYDLLIADIRMPGNGELEFIHNLPDILAGPQVIIVTGYPSMETAIQSIKLPVVAYLIKPIEFSELLSCVEAGVRYQRMRNILKTMQSRLSNWLQEFEKISQSNEVYPKQDSMVTTNIFLQFSFQNIIASLIDVNTVTGMLHSQKDSQVICSLLNCPVHSSLKNAIAEAIDVLEKTKSSFKSKELAELRRKLEEIYRST